MAVFDAKHLSVAFIALAITIAGQAQDLPSEEWTDGTITLTNKEVLYGKVYYQVKANTVFIQREDEIRLLKASRVSKFDFYDKVRNEKRLFLSLPLEVPNRSTFRYEFLEVIKDFGDWQILSHLATRKVVLPAHRYTPAQTVTQIVEKWFIIDVDGTRHLYLSFMQRPLRGPKLEFFNSMLFKKITALNATEIKEYASLNKLSPEVPEDNLLLLEYNEELNKVKRSKDHVSRDKG